LNSRCRNAKIDASGFILIKFFILILSLYSTFNIAPTEDLIMHIADLKQGNEIVYEKVYLLWHVKVYAYFRHKTRSEYMSEELVQLTFIKLWNFRHTLNERLPLETQLFTIARTTMLDFLKKQANQQRLIKEVSPETESRTEPLWEFDFENRVTSSINSLPPMRKQVFLLNRNEGFTAKEIAVKLAISPRTVEKHMSLALRQLKSLLYSIL
jgi:RNA polymerase sigma factor (sigma-70 family)